MATTPGAFWDAKYARDDYFYGKSANAWLMSQAANLKLGMRVLCIADGEGRNGVWLAERGFDVTAVDASPRAIGKARALAAERGVQLQQIEADLMAWEWPEASFDVVVVIFAHFTSDQRPIVHRRTLEALVPGGLVLLEAYSPYQRLHDTGGPKDLDMLYTAWRLGKDFEGAEIIELAELKTELAEGAGHNGTSAVVRLVARRPKAG